MFINYINEAYVGKKGVEELFRIFSEFRTKYRDRPFTTEMNRSEDLIRFNRTTEKIFGFNKFAMYVSTTMGVTNAFTIPFSTSWDRDMSKNENPVISSKNGFKFKEGTDLTGVVFITYELFRHKDFTDGEVFAIVLHEIGHNFTFALHNQIAIYTHVRKHITSFKIILYTALSTVVPLLTIPTIQYALATSSVVKESWVRLDERFRKQGSLPFRALQWTLKSLGTYSNLLYNFYQGLNFLFNILNPIGQAIAGFMFNLQKSINSIIMNILEHVLTPNYDYKNEQISDNFATFYGYGAELSSGLKKLDYGNKGLTILDFTQEVPILSAINDLVSLVQTLPIHMIDEHPMVPARIKAQLDFIENELEKNKLDPLVLAQLKRDKKEIEIVLEELVDQSEEASHHTYFRRIFYGWLLTAHNGDWRSAAIEDDTFKEIDKKFNENYKK